MSPLFQDVEQDFETAVPGAHPKVSQATSSPAEKAAEPAKQAPKGPGDGVAVSGPQAIGDKAAQKAGNYLEASSSQPSIPEVSTKSSGARTRGPAQQSGQQQPVAPSNTPMPRSIILLPEPYANWRERLVGLFRALVPDQADGLFTPGYVGQVYVQRPLSESYLVSAKYDVNVRGGGQHPVDACGGGDGAGDAPGSAAPSHHLRPAPDQEDRQGCMRHQGASGPETTGYGPQRPLGEAPMGNMTHGQQAPWAVFVRV